MILKIQYVHIFQINWLNLVNKQWTQYLLCELYIKSGSVQGALHIKAYALRICGYKEARNQSDSK